MTDVYIAGDSGPSGFGVATRGLVKNLVDVPDINVNFRTHQWGWNLNGDILRQGVMSFPDTRFKEKMIREGHVGQDYLLNDIRDIGDRDDNLMANLNVTDDEYLMIKQHSTPYDEVDIWYAAGGVGFANQAPEGPHTILHCDWNLDIVPDSNFNNQVKQQFYQSMDMPVVPISREMLNEFDLEHEKDLERYIAENEPSEIREDFKALLESQYDGLSEHFQWYLDLVEFYCDEMYMEDGGWGPKLEKVDEVWVPSEWTRDAILNRYPEMEDKVRALPYGIDTSYKPGQYDHENCPNDAHSGGFQRTRQEQCLADDKFNFLVVSRIYHIKGLYRTMKAFIEEFEAGEDVRLFIKTTSNQQFEFNSEQMAQKVVDELQYPNAPEIGIAESPMDTQHMYDLMGHSDCFIQASRAECYGIAPVQAAWCGTPVIATNWSSQRELYGDADGFVMLDDYELESPKPETDGIMFQHSDYYPLDSQWAVPDISELGSKMRQMFSLDEKDRDLLGMAAKRHVSENYTWDDRVHERIDRMREITGEQEVQA